jgi:very-short-patch-repair endonuclease
MEYPIIIRAKKEPPLDLFAKDLSSKANKGENENIIFDLLKENKLPVYSNHFINPYHPDIVIIDKENKLLIDIEIDEPYSYDGELTHYFENECDSERNLYFHEKGIHIIRFSERQVVNHPKSCFRIIDLFIKSLTDPKQELTLKNSCKRISEPRWTKELSNLLHQNKSRRQYPYDIIFPKKDINIKKIDKSIDYFINPVLKEISEDDMLVLPAIVNRVKNYSTGEIGFSYFGLRYSNSDYVGLCTELSNEVSIVLEYSDEYPFFEKYFLERIRFLDNDNVCLPIIIIKKGPNRDSFVIELLK